MPKTSKMQNRKVIGEPPEQTVEVPEPDNKAEIVELIGLQKPPFKLNRLLLYFCWGVFLLSAIFFLIGEYFDYDFSAGELISIQGELDEYHANLSEERDLKNIHHDIQGQESKVTAISSLYPQCLTIVNSLSNSLPDGVWLTLIQSNSKGEIVVKGQSYIFAKVGDYLKRLKEVQLFQSLKLKEIKRKSIARTIFSFTIEIEAGGASLEYTE
jgi:Tfp pilus assembly protein PilN